FLAAMDPGPAGKEAEDGQTGAVALRRQIDIEPLPVVTTVGLVEDAARAPLRRAAERHDALDVTCAVGMDEGRQRWKIVERHELGAGSAPASPRASSSGARSPAQHWLSPRLPSSPDPRRSRRACPCRSGTP